MVGGKPVKNKAGKVIGTTTGRYGGKLNPLATKAELDAIKAEIKKSKTMMFSKANRPNLPEFLYNGKPVQPCTSYTYLGIEINHHGKFTDGMKVLSQKGLKAVFKMRALTSHTKFPVPTSLRLFSSLVRPILTYNADIWYMDVDMKRSRGIHRAQRNNKAYNILHSIDSTVFERIHSRFIKSTLGIHKTTSSNAARMEVGSPPLELFIKLQSIKNWNRIMLMDSALVKEALTCATNLHRNGKYSWASYMQNIFDSLETTIQVDDRSICSHQFPSHLFSEPLVTYYDNLAMTALTSSIGSSQKQGNKLRTYAKFKDTCDFEPYLEHIKNASKRRSVTKLHVSAHRLEIETGRYNGIPAEQRFCQFCPNSIGDEKHFVLHCPTHSKRRAKLITHCEENIAGFSGMGEDSQFLTIMKADTPTLAVALGEFCLSGFEAIK